MPSVLPTASLTVADLFSAPFHFSVPCYQRPYSWTTVEAGQLLEDVFGAAGVGGSTLAAEPDYYLGTILLIDGSGGELPRGREREARLFEIVDGQQRLVTLAILAAVLRDLGADRWRLAGRGRLDQLVGADAGASRLQPAPRFRIELRAREQAILETYVQTPGACRLPVALDDPSKAEERLIAVREHFTTAVAALEDAERRRVADYLCDQCHFVVVLSRDIDRAHRLFTVMNQRGRSLERSDILKAEFLKSLPADRLDDALARWEEAVQLLGTGFESLFPHIHNIYGHGESRIIAGIRRIVAETGGTEAFLRDVLSPLADAYHKVRNASDVNLSLDAEARRYLVYLGRLKEGDWAPAAMLALQQHGDDPARGAQLLKEIDRLAHLLRLSGVGNVKRRRRFAEVIDFIRMEAPVRSGEGPFRLSRDEVRNISYHLRNLYKHEQQTCKLLLLRLNDALSRSTTLLDPRDYSVEHVAPQRPSAMSEWRRCFADAEEREICTASLGNLVVVTKKQNDRARNQEFARKCEIYRSSADDPPVLAITRDAIEASTWGAAEILAREARLYGLIREIWGIDIASRQPAAADDMPRSDVA